MVYTAGLVIILVLVVIIVVPPHMGFLYWYWKGVDTVPPISHYRYLANIILKKEPLFVNLQEFYETMKRKGKTFGGYYLLMRPVFVPTDLNLIKRILIDDFDHFTDHIGYVNAENDPMSLNAFNAKGYAWKNMRSRLSPSFTSTKSKILFDTALKCAQDFKQLINKCIDGNESFDVMDVSERYTTDVVVSSGFGVESKALQSGTSEFRKLTSALMKSFRLKLIHFFPGLFSLFRLRTYGDEITNFFINLVEETAKYRIQNGIVREDFMHQMLQNRRDGTTDCDARGKRDAGLSLSEIAAQSFIFYVGGYETTAAALSFTLTELAINQQIQNKVREEIKAVLGKHNGKITYEAVQEMEYLNNCLYEGLRKYPVLPTNHRLCTKSYKIPNSNVVINEGMYVFLPIYAIHRDPEHFPNPDKFEPDRFSKESTKNRLPSAFLPFGDGPRKCIAYKFGTLIDKVALVVLLKHFKFFVHPDVNIPLQLSSTVILSTLKPLKLKVKRVEE